MKISTRERIALGAIAIVLFSLAALRVPNRASSAVPAGAASPSALRDAATTAREDARLTRVGVLNPMILDPWGGFDLLPGSPVANIPSGGSLVGMTPANPMGFNTAFVPRFGGDTGTAQPAPQALYALGTDYAILSQGGPMIRKGSSIAGGLTVVKIDGQGLYLSDGSILRPSTEQHVAPAATPSSSPSPNPQGLVTTGIQSGPTASPASAPTASPDPRTAVRQLLLYRAAAIRAASASPVPGGRNP